MAAFLGMRGTGDWETSASEDGWARVMFKTFPNGEVTLTNIISRVSSEHITQTQWNWKTKVLQARAGAVSSIYIDADLVTEYDYTTHVSSYGASGSIVYAKCASAVSDLFVPSNTVALVDEDRPDVELVGVVVRVIKNGASSAVAIKLLEADDNSDTPASYNLSSVDRIRLVGDRHAQGGFTPETYRQNPTNVYNVTDITRTPVSITRTAAQTILRGRPNALLDEKAEALLWHGIKREQKLLWSIRDGDGTGANGKPETSMMGIRQFIRTYASDNVHNYRLATAYSGKTWINGGLDWFEDILKDASAMGTGYLGGEVVGICGAGARIGLNKLARENSNYTITSEVREYGLAVDTLKTPLMNIHLIIHPLMNWYPELAYTAYVFPPKHIKNKYIQKTIYFDDARKKKQMGYGRDGYLEEFLTEETYEYNLQGVWMELNGIGQDNIV